MKYFSVFALALVSGSAFAGIPTTVCSSPDGGIQRVSEGPGMEAIIVRLDSEGATARLPVGELDITETDIRVVRESRGAMGSFSKTYFARLSIAKSDGTWMPDAYTSNRLENGSLEADVICEFSIF